MSPSLISHLSSHTSVAPRRDRGFIALISTLIISVTLFVAVISLANKSISSRFLLLDIERKLATEKLAEGCIQTALISIVVNPSHAETNTQVTVDGPENVCTIVSVTPNTPSSGESQVDVQAQLSGATTNYRAVVDATSGAILSRSELPNF